MIKKLTEKEYNRRSIEYAMIVIFGSVFFILSILSIITNFDESGISLLGIYGLPIAIIGTVFLSELEEQKEHPENFVYCKKCKKIIRKKHKFCSTCRNSIKRTLDEIENKKHFKEYKKFYKEKK